MRMAEVERDGFELRSGEAVHIEHPDTFYIPAVRDRYTLVPGQYVKLLFEIHYVGADGQPAERVERMWVLVAGREDDVYFGMLDNDPYSTRPGDGHYLTHGAEIPFLPGHVINIEDPPDNAERMLREWKPPSRWPREDTDG